MKEEKKQEERKKAARLEKIQKEIEDKTSIANLSPTISNKKIKKDKSLRIELFDIPQSKKLITKWLNRISL